MTNFDKMEQNFVALTEEELMEVDGGVAWGGREGFIWRSL